MSGYAGGMLLILFGRPQRSEGGPQKPWTCGACESQWEIVDGHEDQDNLKRGAGCRWCLRKNLHYPSFWLNGRCRCSVERAVAVPEELT